MQIRTLVLAALAVLAIAGSYLAANPDPATGDSGATEPQAAPPSPRTTVSTGVSAAAPSALPSTSPAASGPAQPPTPPGIVAAYREARSFRVLAHQSLSSKALIEAELAMRYYALCAGLPEAWFAPGAPGARAASRLDQVQGQLTEACRDLRGDLQLVRSVVAHRHRLSEQPDAVLRFELIATQRGLPTRVDQATWRWLRTASDAAVVQLLR